MQNEPGSRYGNEQRGGDYRGQRDHGQRQQYGSWRDEHSSGYMEGRGNDPRRAQHEGNPRFEGEDRERSLDDGRFQSAPRSSEGSQQDRGSYRESESRSPSGYGSRPGGDRYDMTGERSTRREGGWGGQEWSRGNQESAGGSIGSQIGGRPGFSQGMPGSDFSGFGDSQRLDRGGAPGRTSHAGKAPKSYKRSDERIREDVYERLTAADVDCGDVQVNVKEGEVTLSGVCPAGESRREIERIAESVSGVVEVTNQIRTRRESDRSEDSKRTSIPSSSEAKRGQQHASPS